MRKDSPSSAYALLGRVANDVAASVHQVFGAMGIQRRIGGTRSLGDHRHASLELPAGLAESIVIDHVRRL